ncbi:hypothetical protein [Aquimarina sp. 2201CG5-10]|uniref:hypothetical protein n=1 Tax=Aquimarina callyspongiae TaxID=3098150 RepID=UPI002AB33B85|nr:hypothetical protein [Aquimarina sp. 2201CG5-10]MDY8137909.1 hypothetical protein [Aquimarina sp. 2201CG5-10]
MNVHSFLPIIFCVIIFTSCNQIKRNINTSGDINNQISKKINLEFELSDSIKNRILENKLWINSWTDIDSTFSINDFEKEFEKRLKLNWFSYKKSELKIKSFDSLLIHSNKGKSIDLYSYNTIFEEEGEFIFVQSGVDTKVFINDSNNSKTELITTGSIEVIEDAFWLNENTIILLGYLFEDKLKPFVWFFQIEENIQARYITDRGFGGKREKHNFLSYKYPRIKQK